MAAKLSLFLAAVLAAQTALSAQGRGRGGAASPPPTARAAAPVDLTGYWVSVVTEDWRYRMVTPAHGDYQGVPMTPAGPHTIQGDSAASWQGGGRGATDGALQVTTTNLKAGFLRKNGVPYSENASLNEYYELIAQPDGTPLLVVTIVTTDPVYLRQPFVISSHFKKEPGDAKWKPTACSATW
jgi:hypothetical protein